MSYEEDFINEVDGDVVAYALADGTDNFEKHGLKRKTKARVNFNMDCELKEWAEKQAEAYGITLTGMLNIAMAQYKMQMEGMSMMKQFPDFFDKLEKASREFESSKK